MNKKQEKDFLKSERERFDKYVESRANEYDYPERIKDRYRYTTLLMDYMFLQINEIRQKITSLETNQSDE